MTFKAPERIMYLDRMRAFWVAMMVIDHGIQGYAQTFGRFWFFEDTQRSVICDALHVFFNALLMPPLFFIAGLWVVPHLQRDGIQKLLKKRVYRLGLPFVVGVIFLVPLMTFPEYHVNVNSYESYFEFWTGAFIWSSLQAGPFWFLSYLMILTSLTALFYHKLPGLIRLCKRCAEWMGRSPYQALILGSLVVWGIQLASDLTWGAPYWISLRGLWDPYGKLVAVQGSRFLLQALYFFVGVGLGQTSVLQNFAQRVREGRVPAWLWWGLLIGVSSLYIWIAQPFDPYSFHAHRATWASFFEHHSLWPVALRTFLQPLVCVLATIVGLITLIRCESWGGWFWNRFALSAYGVYFIHEVMTVGVHYGFFDVDVPIALKVACASFGVLGVSYAVARWILPRVPYLGPVFRGF